MGSVFEEWSDGALEVYLTDAQTLRGLMGVSMENWVILQRNKFDLHADNEPHVAQTLFVERSSGRYLHKIFGQTIEYGHLDTPARLKDLTQKVFENSKVCPGFDCNIKVEAGITLVPGFHPYRTKTDPNCLKVFKDPLGMATVCPNCTQAMGSESVLSPEDNPDGLIQTRNPNEEKRDSTSVDDPLATDVDIEEHSLMEDFFVSERNDESSELDADLSDRTSNAPVEPTLNFTTQDEEGTYCNIESNTTYFVKIEDPLDMEIDFQDPPPEPKKHVNKRRSSVRKPKHIPCDHCDKIFAQTSKYIKHRSLLRLRERILQCKVCRKSQYDSFEQLAKHMRRDHDGDLHFGFKEYLMTPHKIEAMNKVIKCEVCKMSINGNVMFHRHRALYHELGDFKCVGCEQYFLTYYHLVVHDYNQHNIVTPILQPLTEDFDTVNHRDGSIELVHARNVCPICKKVFKHFKLWLNHMKLHHGRFSFTCEQCEGMCHYTDDFIAHQKNFHSDQPEIQCPTCSEMFDINEDPECADTHFRGCFGSSIHKGKKTPFRCKICKKYRSNQENLQSHLDSHERVERYICPKCYYKTNLLPVFHGHQRVHLIKERKLPPGSSRLVFNCDQCPQTFKRDGELTEHIVFNHHGPQNEETPAV